MNEWTATGTFVTPQVRSLRKGNNDHVAIAVDVDPGSTSRVEDEEDDKGIFCHFTCELASKILTKYYGSFYLILVSPFFLLQSMVLNHLVHPKLSQDLLDL